MNESENILKEYIQALSSHDLQKVRQLLHPQYSITGIDGERREGIEAGIDSATMYLNAFPDMNLEIKNIYSAGNVAVAEFIGRGTQRGEIMNIPPTGRQVAVPVCEIIECRDGKIYAEREYFDSAIMMQQLGVRTNQQFNA